MASRCRLRRFMLATLGRLAADRHPLAQRQRELAWLRGLHAASPSAIGWMLWETIEANRRSEIERRERPSWRPSNTLQNASATAELKMLRAGRAAFPLQHASNVVSGIEHEPGTAKHYDRAPDRLPAPHARRLRRDHATVGDELGIIGDYLENPAFAHGRRLWYEIAADDATRALPLAPMLLQPLAENAIKHGLEPKIEGGRGRRQRHCAGRHAVNIAVETAAWLGVATDTAGRQRPGQRARPPESDLRRRRKALPSSSQPRGTAHPPFSADHWLTPFSRKPSSK